MYLGVVRISGRRRIRQPGPKHGTNGRPAIGGPGPESRDSVCRAPRHALPLLLQTVFSRKRTHHHPVCLPCCSMLAYSVGHHMVPSPNPGSKLPRRRFLSPVRSAADPPMPRPGKLLIQRPELHLSSPPHNLTPAAHPTDSGLRQIVHTAQM